MRIHRSAPALLLALLMLAGLGSSGCSSKTKAVFLPNERPTVRLVSAPVDTTQEYFYVYRMGWVGFDPDGRVVRFEYAIDPPSLAGADTAWISTTRNEQIVTFTATQPESLQSVQPRSRGFHVFVIRAVDNQGAESPPVNRAFFSYGVAPTVQIDQPIPNKLIAPTVTPAVRIRFSGKDFIDPNGGLFEKPTGYKYRLFKYGAQYPIGAWLQDPDSLRRQYAPDFVGWDYTGPDSAEVQYTNLTPNSDYLFAVVSFGRSGAYSPVFDLNSNMLRMFVGFAGTLGPTITMFNEFFSYTYPSGGFPQTLDPSFAVQLQVPADRPLTINWFAAPPVGSNMKRYRWVLDLLNLDDETARSNQNDWYHWSSWSLSVTSATVGPFSGAGGDTGEVHNFYVEAEDINGLVSLGWIQFRVFRPTFNRDLLIVDDTRYLVDQKVSRPPPESPDSLRSPSDVWPMAAELDTFMYAVGGVRWRMTPNGMLSPPGIFKGYRYDTLGTREGKENPTVPLNLLGQYRHIIWMTDGYGSLFAPGEIGGGPTSPTQPMTTLRYMCSPNRQNTLATWVSQGGKLWGLGGGFANATNSPWNNRTNDVGTRVYTSLGSRPDLTAGRFMYDIARWKSEFRVLGPATVFFARMDQPDPFDTYAPGAWPGQPYSGPNAGLYASALPPSLDPKNPADDPISVYGPYRNAGDFYVNSYLSANGVNVEYLAVENYIYEILPVPGFPDSTEETSTLDTLYLTYGGYPGKMLQAGEGVNAVMTLYRGGAGPLFVFSGFTIWHFTRPQCVALVDFVLNRLWGLQRSLTAPGPGGGAIRPALVRKPTAVPMERRTMRPSGGAQRQPAVSADLQRMH